MIISLNWLKKYTEIKLPTNELAELIGARLVEIEKIIDLKPRYDRIVIAEIKRASEHQDADKLGIYHIDDQAVINDVERLEDGLVQVVSGDRALKVGDKVAWLAPGSIVPSTYEESSIKLEARQMRGEISHGMLGSGKELGINSDADSVLVLDTDAPAGTSFAEAYELDDILFDIANKSLTHRPDSFGVIGFAREVAAIQGVEFNSPAWYLSTDSGLIHGSGSKEKSIEINIEDNDLCARYQAAVISGASVGQQSPQTIQGYLKRVGIRPINAAVDVTNYLMVITGQPLHAFDYDKFAELGGSEVTNITVRSARDNEPLKLLDGRTITLQSGDIVICSSDTPVALAGVMGGAEAEISEDTKTILLESATFNLYNVRGTTMRHGIFSDAAMRFTKGQSAEQTTPVLASAVKMLSQVTGGQCLSDIAEAYPGKLSVKPIIIDAQFINAVLGSDFSAEDISKALKLAEFEVRSEGDSLAVTAPYWRADIHIAEDIAEEVGRLHGFDNLTPSLPERSIKAVLPATYDIFRSNVRRILARAGASEVLTYSFVHSDLFKKVGQDEAKAFRITNAISPELQYYRLSLLPSLLDKNYGNLRQGYGEFALFEINKVHRKDNIDTDSTPAESHRLALSFAADDKTANEKYEGAAYYQAKRILNYLGDSLRVSFEYRLFENNNWDDQAETMFEPRRSAHIFINGETVGIVGEYKNAVKRNLKLPTFSAGFELDTQKLFSLFEQAEKAYQSSSRYPGTDQDVCFKVKHEIAYSSIVEAAERIVDDSEYDGTVIPVDVYSKEEGFKQLTIKVNLVSHDRTITTAEASELVGRIAAEVSDKYEASVI